MKQERCASCGNFVPMNSMLTFKGKPTCESCVDAVIMQGDHESDNEIARHIDPTICFNCSYDNGGLPLRTLSRLPACDKCIHHFRNRPFPTWLKVSFVALMVIIALHLVHNRRFWLAYREVRQAQQAEDILAMSALYESAVRRVPESAGLRAMSDYVMGLINYREQRMETALLYLESCRDYTPPDFEVDRMIQVCRASLAFDRKDYDSYLRIAADLRNRYRDDPVEWARLASALACKYAVTADQKHYELSVACLDSAIAMSHGHPAINEYGMRIRHRLQTGDIISPEEFYERYPNGWVEGDN